MNIYDISAGTTVARALEVNPGVAAVLNAHRTACVGCYLARFCTLGDLTNYYEMPLEAFIAELRQAPSAILSSQGANNA